MVQLNDYILNHIAKTPLILSRYNKERRRFDYSILKEKVDKYIENDKIRAAKIGVNFLDPDGKIGLNPQVLQNVFSQPKAIRWDGLYPKAEELDKIQKYMFDVMKIGKLIDLDKFIENTFADNAYS